MGGTHVEPDEAGPETSWRERSVERSLRAARAKAVSRSDRFIATAVEILSETGRTDFTVQELVERAKTSLRSFYQHFRSKDELLLALFEDILGSATAVWREEIAEMDSLSALHRIVEKVHGRSGRPVGARINRALSSYHLQLADAHPLEYARVLAPLRDIILECIERGIDEGVMRTDMDANTLAILMMQTLVGAAHMEALRTGLASKSVDSERLWDFCVGGLVGSAPKPPAGSTRRTPAGRAPASRTARAGQRRK